MNATDTTRTRLHPISEEDVRLVRKELEAVLTTPHFASSKRYPAFLTYVVEKTLEGETGHLKERTLGVEVFQRRPDYDTNSDTIVRFAAGEVRKRLALVYHESTTDHPVQIVLAVGSYSPEFFLLNPEHDQPGPGETTPVPAQPWAGEPLKPAVATRAWGWRRWLVVLVLAGVAALAGLGWLARQHLQATGIDRFWQPLLSSPTPVLIAPGAMVYLSAVAGAARADKTVDYPYVSMATAASLTDIVAMLARDKDRYVIEPSSVVTLTEMRQRPVVLLGAYSNDWTPRALDELRFRFSPQVDLKIYDTANPSVTWTRSTSIPYSEADDFAIIARFHAKLTQNPMLVLAGIGKNGTEAATQFVTDPRYLNSLDQSLPKGWANKNIEIVIRTKVIGGKTGEPTIEAVHLW